LLNNGAAAGFSSTTYPSGLTCRQVYGGDLDGDGDVDLVTTGYSDNTLNIHRNNGNGTFAPRSPINVSNGPFAVFIGDMNLDGLPDLVAGFQGVPRQLQIFLNQGGMAFPPGATLTVGSGTWDISGSDLDGDGDLDLASVEASSTSFASGLFPLGVFTADLDGDDDDDILCSDFSGADVRVFENAGGNQYPLADILPTVQSGSYAWAHDLDGDSDLDVTLIDELADRIFVFENPAAPTGIPPGGGGAPAARLELLLPFPDPATFTGTTIGYRMPPGSGPLRLRLYDVAGRLVRTLVDGPAPAKGVGQARWDTRAASGDPVASGVYLIRLEEGGRAATGRVNVLR
jgi:hypothetical protein